MYTDKIAVIHKETNISYLQLVLRSYMLSKYFKQHNIGHNDIVAISMQISIDYICSMIATWMIGAVYLPIDVSEQASRVMSILEQSNCKFLIHDSNARDIETNYLTKISLDFNMETQFIQYTLDEISTSVFNGDIHAPALYASTSGSTGRPKIVCQSHFSIIHLCVCLIDQGWNSNDAILQLSKPSFSAHIREICGSLFFGATLVLRENQFQHDIHAIVDTIACKRISKIYVVSSLFNAIYEYVKLQNLQHQLKTLNLIAFIGEPMKWLDCFHAREVQPDVVVINNYGQTETMVHTMFNIIPPSLKIEQDDNELFNNVPLGNPRRDLRYYIKPLSDLDFKNECIKEGELVVIGKSICYGYVNNIENDVLFRHISLTNDVEFNTKDVVRVLSDDNIIYVGRSDFQIKIRGQRIEVEEIEKLLMKHNRHIERVIVSFDGSYLIANLKFLPTVNAQESDILSTCKQICQSHFPDYMIPSVWRIFDTFPTLANGKVDRNKLSTNVNLNLELFSAIPPSNSMEHTLLEIYSEVVGVNNIGINHHLVDHMKVNSLQMMQIIARIQHKFNLFGKVTVHHLLLYGTIAEMSRFINQLVSNVENHSFESEFSLTAIQTLQVSFQQKRYCKLDTVRVYAYDIIKGNLDVSWLKSALKKLVTKHTALRTYFQLDGKLANQIIVDAENIDYIVLQMHSDSTFDAFMNHLIQSKPISPNFLGNTTLHKSLVQFYCTEFNDNSKILFMIIHHCCYDGSSLSILQSQISDLFSNNGHYLKQSNDSWEYIDYCTFYHKLTLNGVLDEQYSFWKQRYIKPKMLCKWPKYLSTSCSNKSPNSSKQLHVSNSFRIQLNKVCALMGCTIFQFVLAVTNVVFSTFTEEFSFIIGGVIANRSHPSTEQTVGPFSNYISYENQFKPDTSIEELLKLTQMEVANVISNSTIAFEDIMKRFYRETGNQMDLFNIMLMVQDYGLNYWTVGDSLLKYRPENITISNLAKTIDLMIWIRGLEAKSDDPIVFVMNYRECMFHESTINSLLQTFLKVAEDFLQQLLH